MRDPAFILSLVFILGLLVLWSTYKLVDYLANYTLLSPIKINLRGGKTKKYSHMVCPRYILKENKRLKGLLIDKNKQLAQQARGHIKREPNNQMTYLPSVSRSGGGKPTILYTAGNKRYWLTFKSQQALTRFNSEDWVWVARETRKGKGRLEWGCQWAHTPEKKPDRKDEPLDLMYYDHRYDTLVINKIPPTYNNKKGRKEVYIEDHFLPFSWEVEELTEEEPPNVFNSAVYEAAYKELTEDY